jgi:hypothetical protein
MGKKPELLKDKINFQVMNTNTWKHVSNLDKMHTSTLKFYLQDHKNATSVFNKPEPRISQSKLLILKTEQKDFIINQQKDSIKMNNSIVLKVKFLIRI